MIAVDLRGHGHSGHSDHYPLNGFRDDLAFVVDQLGLDDFDLIGHSLGAHTALRYAMEYPDRLNSIVLEEVPPMPRDQSDLDEKIAPSQSFGAAARGLLAIAANPGPLLRYDRAVGPEVGEQFEVADPAWWETLEAVNRPTLVISGGSASFLPPHHLRTLTDHLRNGAFVEIAAGHSVHRDQPRAFGDTVAAFLSAHRQHRSSRGIRRSPATESGQDAHLDT